VILVREYWSHDPEVVAHTERGAARASARPPAKGGGLTQAELGRLAGLRQATISSVESGAPGTEVSTVFAILAVLGAQIVLEGRTFGPPTVVGRHGD